jgi:hypothetical protein
MQRYSRSTFSYCWPAFIVSVLILLSLLLLITWTLPTKSRAWAEWLYTHNTVGQPVEHVCSIRNAAHCFLLWHCSLGSQLSFLNLQNTWCDVNYLGTQQFYELKFMIELSLYVTELEKYVSALCGIPTGVPDAYSNFNRSSLCCLTIITIAKNCITIRNQSVG